MSATLHKLPNITDEPDWANVGKDKVIPTKTYALIRKVGGIYHIRLGRYRVSVCRVKG